MDITTLLRRLRTGACLFAPLMPRVGIGWSAWFGDINMAHRALAVYLFASRFRNRIVSCLALLII